MSDEPFLARWTRRKSDAARSPIQAPKSPRPADEIAEAPPATAEIAATPQMATPNAAEPDPAPVFDLNTLPALDTITAQSDIRAFLAPGVPAELTRAALRRAWAADPAIRDFIGIAENQWDFTAPDAMPGFGPLGDSDEVRDEVRRMVARVFGEAPAKDDGADEPDAAPEKREQEQGSAIAGVDDMTQQSAPQLPIASSAAEVVVNIVQRGDTNTAPQYSQPEDGNWGRPKPRPHGGALPR